MTKKKEAKKIEVIITRKFEYDPESVKEGYRLLYHYLAEDMLKQVKNRPPEKNREG